MAESIPIIHGSLNSPRVRKITAEQPWQWLAAGWRDTLATPLASGFYGIIFVVMGYYLTFMVAGKFHMALALGTGFLLGGPFLATGLYALSRSLERGEAARFGSSLIAWNANLKGILLFGIVLGLVMIVWARLSAVIFALVFLNSSTPSVDSSATHIFFSGDGLRFLVVFMSIGAVIASVVFAISVVSIPMLLDRNVDVITAVVTSLTAVRLNPGPMVLWAALIVVFTGVGLATFFLGLAITVPLIGHATWYAYRDLVEPERKLS